MSIVKVVLQQRIADRFLPAGRQTRYFYVSGTGELSMYEDEPGGHAFIVAEKDGMVIGVIEATEDSSPWRVPAVPISFADFTGGKQIVCKDGGAVYGFEFTHEQADRDRLAAGIKPYKVFMQELHEKRREQLKNALASGRVITNVMSVRLAALFSVKQEPVSVMKFPIVFFVALALLLPSIARADQLEDGRGAFYGEEYDKAIQLLLPLAKHGNAEAQEKVGEMFLYGLGVNKYCERAVEWLTKSANQRYLYASHLLGRLYDDGQCENKDNIKAYMWYTLAASELPKDPTLDPETLETYAIAGVRPPPGEKNWKLINSIAVDRKVLGEVMRPEEIAEAKHLAKEWKPETDEDDDE